ncbi:glucose-1-phosphate thymidylyltransferase RfbA [Gammaproteobacteria bacterium]|nr:glucose-1-phosphate thymidylyltransferase RfbA [Gammaproteobacteria bacterium]
MKGIILAGGSGSRLFPLTKVVSKQLMPIYDKPMIYYPLSTLMLAGITEVLIISTKEDLPRFKDLLGNGSQIGMKFEFIIQPSPDGLAQAFILGKDFIGKDDVCLILGDNIFYGQGIEKMLNNAVNDAKNRKLATVFGYHVNDPERYGVVSFNDEGKALNIKEKPSDPESNYAVTGLYFYPNDVIKKSFQIVPSDRGELEITSINQLYLNENRLGVQIMGRGYAWLDTGTHESLLEASSFIEVIERRQGLKVACIEEIAFEQGYINKKQFLKLANQLSKNQYGKYLLKRIHNLK